MKRFLLLSLSDLADRLSTPKNINLPFHKAHPGLRDPKVTLDHHNFVDRPPWVGGGLPPGECVSLFLCHFCSSQTSTPPFSLKILPAHATSTLRTCARVYSVIAFFFTCLSFFFSIGHGAIIEAEGKTHRNCPAMKARSGVGGITLHMPYTVRFYREGSR